MVIMTNEVPIFAPYKSQIPLVSILSAGNWTQVIKRGDLNESDFFVPQLAYSPASERHHRFLMPFFECDPTRVISSKTASQESFGAWVLSSVSLSFTAALYCVIATDQEFSDTSEYMQGSFSWSLYTSFTLSLVGAKIHGIDICVPRAMIVCTKTLLIAFLSLLPNLAPRVF